MHGLLACGPLALVAVETGPAGAVSRLVDADAVNRFDAQAVQDLAAGGVATAMQGVPSLAEERPRLRSMVLAAVAAAARCRGWDPELLRCYDPAGHRMFYGEDRPRQELLRASLAWREWPPELPEALVHAAPLPTLAWLDAQGSGPTASTEQVRRIVEAWGGWIRLGRERQHLPEVRRRFAALFSGPLSAQDPKLRAALARALGDAAAQEALPALAAALADPVAAVRAESAAALGKLGGESALRAIVGRLVLEPEAPVAARMAETLGRWPDPAAGDAALAVLRAGSAPTVRRAAVLAAGSARWAVRAEIIHLGLLDADGMVVGAALRAVAEYPAGIAPDAVLDLAADHQRAQPELVDALGALRDPRASLLLAAWLRREDNAAVQVALIRALRSIGDGIAGRAIAGMLDASVDALVVEHVLDAIDGLALAAAVPRLVALADDRTAPPGVRLGAIRALGRFDAPDARACLARLATGAAAAFAPVAGQEDGVMAAELIDRARIETAVARFRRGETGASAAVQAAWNGGNASARHALLAALAVTSTSHPVLREGLRSREPAVLTIALRCARAVGAGPYRDDLLAVQRRALLRGLDAGVDGGVFAAALADALRAADPTAGGVPR